MVHVCILIIDLLAASKGSRSEENSLSTSPVVPKPTQTRGRGRGEIANMFFIQKVMN